MTWFCPIVRLFKNVIADIMAPTVHRVLPRIIFYRDLHTLSFLQNHFFKMVEQHVIVAVALAQSEWHFPYLAGTI